MVIKPTGFETNQLEKVQSVLSIPLEDARQEKHSRFIFEGKEGFIQEYYLCYIAEYHHSNLHWSKIPENRAQL